MVLYFTVLHRHWVFFLNILEFVASLHQASLLVPFFSVAFAVESCSEQKILFKTLLFIDNVPGQPRTLMEMYSETNVVSVPNTASGLKAMD